MGGRQPHDDLQDLNRLLRGETPVEWVTTPSAPKGPVDHDPETCTWNGCCNESLAKFAKWLAGATVHFSAEGSTDPDGDGLCYRWWVYAEAGSYRGAVRIRGADRREAALAVPGDARGENTHVILEVTDDDQPPLTSYRRVVSAR